MKTPLIIAHRTCPPYAPENSLEGIGVAFQQGADGVEIDLRMSLDQRPFLMHDNSMWRTAGWPMPIELTPSRIVQGRRLRGNLTLRDECRSFAARSASGTGAESPPTLDDAIGAVPVDKLLAVDVKTPWSILPLIRAVKESSIEARTLVWCSSERVVQYAARHLPGCEIGYYKDYADGPSNVEFVGKAGRIGANAVSLDWRGINEHVVAAAHALGLKVYSWHKEHAITAEQIESGLDGVITDHPGATRERLKAIQGQEGNAGA